MSKYKIGDIFLYEDKGESGYWIVGKITKNTKNYYEYQKLNGSSSRDDYWSVFHVDSIWTKESNLAGSIFKLLYA